MRHDLRAGKSKSLVYWSHREYLILLTGSSTGPAILALWASSSRVRLTTEVFFLFPKMESPSSCHRRDERGIHRDKDVQN